MHPSSEVIYNGQRIQKHHFRAFVYGLDDKTKLVNSWDEFEAHMATGLWFPSKEDVPTKAIKTPRKKPIKSEVLEVESEAFKSIEDHIFPEGVEE